MKAEELLVLKHDDLSRRTETLYQELSRSRPFRELFVTDPASVIADTLLTGYRDYSGTQIKATNRLLFSLLSNARFMRWTEEFKGRLDDQASEILQEAADPIERAALMATTLDKTRIYQEIADAMLNCADRELLYSLFDLNSAKPNTPVIEPYVYRDGHGDDVFPIVTFVLFVFVAIAVFPLYAAPPNADAVGLSRQDFQAVSAFLTDRLSARAQELRDSEVLTSIDPAKRGWAL